MPGLRKSDQKVDAFSAPKSLLRLAEQRAAALRLTKSGYYRYALARDLGFSESEARDMAESRNVTQHRERVAAYPQSSQSSPYVMNASTPADSPAEAIEHKASHGKGKPLDFSSSAVQNALAAEDISLAVHVAGPPAESQPSAATGGQTARKAGPARGTGRRSRKPSGPPVAAPK